MLLLLNKKKKQLNKEMFERRWEGGRKWGGISAVKRENGTCNRGRRSYRSRVTFKEALTLGGGTVRFEGL